MTGEAKSKSYKKLDPARVRALKLVGASARLKKLRDALSGKAEQGVFIPTQTPLPTGAFVEFEFSLSDNSPSYGAVGTVRSAIRSPEGRGMAVQFVSIERIVDDSIEVDPEALWKKVTEIRDLPTLPAIVTRIMQMTVSETTTAGEIARLISQDAVLSAEVLRLVNSAYYSLRQPVTTIERAIVVLGFNRIKSLVLTASVVDLWENAATQKGFDLTAFWEHSLGVAVACETIAKASGLAPPEDAFVAGLFHDLGKVVLDQFMGNVFAAVLQKVETRGTLIRRAEIDVMGFAHDRIGEWLLAEWNIPDIIVLGVANHHLPELAGEARAMAHIINLGDIITRALLVGSGGDSGMPELSESTWKFMGLTPLRLDYLMGMTLVGIDVASDFFRLIRR